MRTVILLGSIIISDSIRGSRLFSYGESLIKFIGIILIISMCMDIVDFFRGRKEIKKI